MEVFLEGRVLILGARSASFQSSLWSRNTRDEAHSFSIGRAGWRTCAFVSLSVIASLSTCLTPSKGDGFSLSYKEKTMNILKLVIIFVHALIGWALCAATMGIGLATLPLQNALTILPPSRN